MNRYKHILNLQKRYLEDKKTINVDERIKNLKKLKSIIKKYENDIIKALELDLGKHIFESYSNEVGFVYSSIDYTIWKCFNYRSIQLSISITYRAISRCYIRWKYSYSKTIRIYYKF